MNDKDTEIEKKYRLASGDKDRMLAALGDINAEFSGEDFEENILFANAALIEDKCVLRLRRVGVKTVLTFKRELEPVGGAKRHLEHETKVEDFGVAAAIFENLGLSRSIVYEKRRRKWNFREVEIVIDELPFGDFMEIEGRLTAIVETEMLLGASDLEVEQLTYPALTAKFGETRGEVIEARFPKGEN